MPLILNDASGNSYQIAITDQGQFGYAPVTAQPAQNYPILDPLTGTTYILAAIQLTGPDQGPLYDLADPGDASGSVYTLFSDGGVFFQFGVLYGQLAAWIPPLLPPRIVYPSGGSNVLLFTTFPRYVPATVGVSGSVADYNAIRIDNVFSSGASQAVYRRTDQFWTAVMENVRATAWPPNSGDDVAAWQKFKLYSLAAGQLVGANTIAGDGSFDLYYSQSSGNFDTYLDEETEWKPMPMPKTGGYNAALFTFPLKFRIRIQE